MRRRKSSLLDWIGPPYADWMAGVRLRVGAIRQSLMYLLFPGSFARQISFAGGVNRKC
jgi:hypothetical protein